MKVESWKTKDEVYHYVYFFSCLKWWRATTLAQRTNAKFIQILKLMGKVTHHRHPVSENFVCEMWNVVNFLCSGWQFVASFNNNCLNMSIEHNKKKTKNWHIPHFHQRQTLSIWNNIIISWGIKLRLSDVIEKVAKTTATN